jgi:hypothetical protein
MKRYRSVMLDTDAQEEATSGEVFEETTEDLFVDDSDMDTDVEVVAEEE